MKMPLFAAPPLSSAAQHVKTTTPSNSDVLAPVQNIQRHTVQQIWEEKNTGIAKFGVKKEYGDAYA